MQDDEEEEEEEQKKVVENGNNEWMNCVEIYIKICTQQNKKYQAVNVIAMCDLWSARPNKRVSLSVCGIYEYTMIECIPFCF